MAALAITPSQLADLQNASLPALHKARCEATQALTDYPLYNLIFAEGSSVESAPNGTQWEERIRLRDANATYNVGLFQGKPYRRSDVLGVVRYDWVNKTHKSLIMDAREEFLNQGEARILQESAARHDAAYADILNTIERELAGRIYSATPSGSDQLPMLGLQFLAGAKVTGTDTTGGFNGSHALYGDGTSTQTVGSIDRSNILNTRARSWVATHDGTFGENTREILRRAIAHTDFKTVTPIPTRSKTTPLFRTGRQVILVPRSFHLAYESVANKATESLDGDLAKFYGTRLTFRGLPLIPIELWDNDSLLSIIKLNTRHVFGVRKEGWWLKMGESTQPDGEAETVRGMPIYVDGMVVCNNFREGIVHIHAQVA